MDETLSARAKAIYVFASEKGAALLDKDRETISRIILETSSGSKYTQRQLRADAKVDVKVQAMREKLAAADVPARRAASMQVEKRICELDHDRQLDRICAVVDFGPRRRRRRRR